MDPNASYDNEHRNFLYSMTHVTKFWDLNSAGKYILKKKSSEEASSPAEGRLEENSNFHKMRDFEKLLRIILFKMGEGEEGFEIFWSRMLSVKRILGTSQLE